MFKIITILVGSSSNKTFGLENKAWAKDNLILQPPENALVGNFCSSCEKPKPERIVEALYYILYLKY